KKKHVLIIGEINKLLDYMNFMENNYSIITTKYEYDTVSSVTKYAANVVYYIETPNYFDANCFENKIEQILIYVKKIIKDFGDIDSVVSTSEPTVLPAAIIRTKYGIKGLK